MYVRSGQWLPDDADLGIPSREEEKRIEWDEFLGWFRRAAEDLEEDPDISNASYMQTQLKRWHHALQRITGRREK